MLHTRPAGRRFALRTVAGVAAGALLTLPGAWAAPASAAQWCELDPPVPITTLGGSEVVVHVTAYGKGLIHQAAVDAAQITHFDRPVDGRRATAVTVFVFIPGDEHDHSFETRSVISTEPYGKGQILATDSGYSGRVMQLRFTLDIP
ncbi:MAG: hypothetical protein ACRDJN_21380 [Chloroflexota bacterium]